MKGRYVFIGLLICSLLGIGGNAANSTSLGRSLRQPLDKHKGVLKEGDWLQPKYWIIEMQTPAQSNVYFKKDRIIIDARHGATLWFTHEFKGDYVIEYDRKVLLDGPGAHSQKHPNDRLSDFNQFWMASDPKHPTPFNRNGVLAQYDGLALYYFGFGGNTNKTTRFRKYEGNGQRTLLQEYKDSAHLLKANRIYHVKTLVKAGETSVWINNVLYFHFKDPHPLTIGYFAFRTTWSRQEITNFTYYALPM